MFSGHGQLTMETDLFLIYIQAFRRTQWQLRESNVRVNEFMFIWKMKKSKQTC